MSPMRRLAIFAVALFCLLPGRPAQSQIKLAVTGGANLSTLDFDNPWTWHGRALGVAFGLPVSDKWSIQLAAHRSGKGYWEEYDEVCPPGWRMPCVVASGISLTYFEVMALADRRIELRERVRLHLLGGLFWGYQGGDPHSEAFDHGVGGGAQVEVGLNGNWGLQAGTLYTHGILNTGSTYKGGDAPIRERKTRTLTLRTGFSYSIR